ncbi:MAG: AMP-binding protein, partial [Tumebacillaceae bacterium]
MKSVTTSIAIGEPFACPHDSLYQALVESAAKQPEHPAMIFYQTQISYQNLLQQVEQFSAFLASKGVVKGDRVAIMLPNCPQYVIAFYACARMGAVVVQVNPMYVPREVEFTVQDAGAKVLVVYDPLYATLHEQEWVQHLSSVVTVSFAAGTDGDAGGNVTAWERMLQTDVPVPAAAEIDPAEDVAVLQYTGGTTGRSKGAMLTHRNLVANAWQSIQILGGNAIKPEDKILSVIPLVHVYGMSICMNMAIFCGSTMVILPRFQLEEVLQTIKTHQPRFFPGVPTMYVAIANH